MSGALVLLQQTEFTSHPEAQRRIGILHYMLNNLADARTSFEHVLQGVPEDPLSLKLLFGCLNGLGQPGPALAMARRAVVAAPRDAQLRNALGAMLVNEGDIVAAIEQFQTALQINPSDRTPLANLEVLNARFGAAGFQSTNHPLVREIRANVIKELSAKLVEGRLSLEDADLLCTLTNNHAETFRIAEQIESVCKSLPDLPVGLLINFAIVCQNRGDLAGALDAYHRAAMQDSERTEVRNGLGALYISEGQTRWMEGWRRVSQTYRTLNPRNYPSSLPQWTGQQITTGRLFVHFDQGVGDALLGLRFVERAASAGIKIVLWLPVTMAGLVDSFSRLADVVVSAERPDAQALGCTFACGLMELIAPLEVGATQISAAPTLALPETATAKWKTRLAALTGKKIGLVALGNPHRVDDWLRSVPPEHLGQLADVEGVTWVNLAVDDRPDKQELIDALQMVDLAPDLRSFADTAAVLKGLDLLITIDCAVAHLAGSVGTPFWLFKPTMLDWRWQIGEVLSPWWPKARVFSAESPGQWHGSVARLKLELEEFLRTPAKRA